MDSTNIRILEELQELRRLMTVKAEVAAQPTLVTHHPATRMMTEYDCLLICSSDDVLGAIDRWNKSRRILRREKKIK